jgi:hypothetical protein
LALESTSYLIFFLTGEKSIELALKYTFVIADYPGLFNMKKVFKTYSKHLLVPRKPRSRVLSEAFENYVLYMHSRNCAAGQ